jgi:hypothetical protein
MSADHLRKAFALIEARSTRDLTATAHKAHESGVIQSLDMCRETMYEAVNMAALLVHRLAEQAGRTVEDLLQELRMETEYAISDLHEQLGIHDDPRPGAG